MNYLAIFLASVAQFIIGAVWYTPIFGRIWGRIHGFDMLSPEQKKKLQQEMVPLLVTQFVVTIVTTTVLSFLIQNLPESSNVYALAALLWIGFVVPTQVAAVIFGGTKPEWFVQKTLIMASASLICLEVAAAILALMPA